MTPAERLSAWRALEAELRQELLALAGRTPGVYLVSEGALVSESVYGDGAPYYLLTVHLAERPSGEAAAALCAYPRALVHVAVGGWVLARGYVPGREGGAQGVGPREELHPDDDED